MSEEQELDYMSDVFLQQTDDGDGLVKSRSTKRSHEMSKRKAAKDEENRKRNRAVGAVEAEKRDSGLSAPLSQDNKGFQLLSRMGFTPGRGLGKTESGRVDPVGVEVKEDRSGLGLRAEVMERLSAAAEVVRRGPGEEELEDFRRRRTEESVARRASSDLAASQRICHQLDLAHGLSQPDEEWFWPPREVEGSEDAGADSAAHLQPQPATEQITVVEKLRQVTEYLREVHYYCVWCGTRYRGEVDMNSQCPGDTREQH